MADDCNPEALSAQQRLCWWRDMPHYFLEGFPKEKAADPEARYRYERAQAEVQFLASSDGLKAIPVSGNEVLISHSLESLTSMFLHHALAAFGDCLLDKRIPATEALQELDQHANELLTDTFNRKWLLVLRHFEFMDDPTLEEQFWAVQTETVANTRREFEKLLWKAELEELRPPVGRERVRRRGDETQMTPSGSASTHAEAETTVYRRNPAESDGKGRKRGPKLGLQPGARAAFVMPILHSKGMSILDWANECNVDFHTANDFLKDKTTPYPSTRKKLAEGLGVDVEKLPE